MPRCWIFSTTGSAVIPVGSTNLESVGSSGTAFLAITLPPTVLMKCIILNEGSATTISSGTFGSGIAVASQSRKVFSPAAPLSSTTVTIAFVAPLGVSLKIAFVVNDAIEDLGLFSR